MLICCGTLESEGPETLAKREEARGSLVVV